MTKKVQLTLDFEASLDEALSAMAPGFSDYRILSKSLDARHASKGTRPKYHYTVEVIKAGERFSAFQEIFQGLGPHLNPTLKNIRPIIIGAGPAGLFCALRLSEYGIASTVIERGGPAGERMKKIAKFWRHGVLDQEDNVCFGEGGAGLFSDGKLITRIKSPYVSYVMNKLVDFGAPADVAYTSNPHLGSNRIRPLIVKLAQTLKDRGCQILYHQRVDQILLKERQVEGVQLSSGQKIFSPWVVMASGHSSDELYHHLQDIEVAMAPKDFAVGVRVEHSRRQMDQWQYGQFAKQLGAARYRFSWENPQEKRGTYSFCMCPGGLVLSTGTNKEGHVTNGMSNYAHNSPWSNAAIVVAIKAGVDFKQVDVLSGLDFQRKIEAQAFSYSKQARPQEKGRNLCAQKVEDFFNDRQGSGPLSGSCPSGHVSARLDQILPSFVTQHLKLALEQFNRQLTGAWKKQALLIAPETRTSSPLQIPRDKMTLESTNTLGLYPCGEGAGHAGGITSAAVDGVKVAMALLQKERGLNS